MDFYRLNGKNLDLILLFIFLFILAFVAVLRVTDTVNFTYYYWQMKTYVLQIFFPQIKYSVEVLTDFLSCGHRHREELVLTPKELGDYLKYTERNLIIWKQVLNDHSEDMEEKNRLFILKKNLFFCHDCRLYEFLGTYEGKIGVFHGTPEKKGPLKEVVAIDISELPVKERKDLEEGIPVNDTVEKLLYFESYSE